MQIFVPIDASGEVGEIVEAIRTLVADELPDGFEGWVTGPAGFTADLVEGFLGIDGLLLGVALIAVFLILVIVYRSPLLPVLVLLTSMFALCVALLTVWWLAYAGIVVLNGQVQGILFILVIGAATDYALLYVARFREAIATGMTKWDATISAWRGAFEPILASGGTVIAGAAVPAALRPRHEPRPRADRVDRHRLLGAVGADVPAGAARALRPRRVLAVHPEAAARDDPRRPDAAGQGPLATTGALRRAPRPRGVDRVHRRAARRRRRHHPAEGRRRALERSRARGIRGARRPGGARRALPGGVGAARPTSSCPRTTSPTPRRCCGRRTAIESVAVASEDSPTGQATVEVEDGEAGADGGRARRARPHREPTVVGRRRASGDRTLTDAADSAEAEDTVDELRNDLDDALGAGTALVGGVTAIDIDTNDTSIRDRTRDHPGRAARHPAHPDAAAARRSSRRCCSS